MRNLFFSIIVILQFFYFGLSSAQVETPKISDDQFQMIKELVKKIDQAHNLKLSDINSIINGFSTIIKKQKYYFFKGQNSTWNIAMMKDSMELAKVFHLNSVVAIVSTNKNSINLSKIPKELKANLAKYKSGTITLEAGIKIYSQVATGTGSGPLSKMASIMGFSGETKLSGDLSIDSIKHVFTGVGEVGDYDFDITIPRFNPPLLSKVMNGRDMKISYQKKKGGESRVSADYHLDFTMPMAMRGKKFSFKSDLKLVNPGMPNMEINIDTGDKLKLAWREAFGQRWINFEKVNFGIDFKKSGVSVVLRGIFDKKNVEVDFDEKNGSLENFVFKLKDSIKLSDFPGLKKIPGANKFELTDVEVAHNSITGKTTFKEVKVDMALFKTDTGGWTSAIDMHKDISLGKLVGKNIGLLKLIKIPAMNLIFSSTGYHGNVSELPAGAHKILGQSSGSLSVDVGISLHGEFDPNHMTGAIKKGLDAIGMKSKLKLEGSIGGVFSGKPSISLDAILSQKGQNMFSFLKSHGAAKEEFFISLSGEEIDLGIKTVVSMPGGHGSHDLIFDTSFELESRASDVEVAVKGEMQGDWKNAIGIKGLTIENPLLEVGINSEGSFDVLLAGTFLMGDEDVTVAADIVISPGAAFLPTAIALAGKINKLDFSAITKHGNSMAKGKHGKKLKGGGFSGFNSELRNVAFAIMTPGSHLPAKLAAELKIQGAGYALKGDLYINGREVGSASGYVSESGIGIDGDIKPFKMGPLDLRSAKIDIASGVSVSPKFAFKGDMTLFKGFKEKFDLELSERQFKFYIDSQFGGLFAIELDAHTTNGLSFSANNDLDFEASLDTGHISIFKDLMGAALKGFKKEDKKLKKAQNDLKTASNSVKKIKSKISKAKAEDKKNREKVTKAFSSSKSRVDKLSKTSGSLKSKISKKKKQIKSDKRHWRWGSAAKHGIELGVLYTELGSVKSAIKVADKVLDTAKKATKKFPKGATPKVIALEATLETELEGVKIAQGYITTIQKINSGLEAATKALQSASAHFRVEKITVAGSIAGITSMGHRGLPPKISVKCKIGNSHHTFVVIVSSGAKDLKKVLKHIAEDAAKELVKSLTKA